MLQRVRRHHFKVAADVTTDNKDLNPGHDPGVLRRKRLHISSWGSRNRVTEGGNPSRQPLGVDDIIASTVSVLSAVRDCSDAMPPLKSVISAAVILLDLVRVRHSPFVQHRRGRSAYVLS